MDRSKFLNINFRDVGRAVGLAVVSSVIIGLYAMTQQEGGIFSMNIENLKVMVNGGLAAGLAYLIKNFFEDREGTLGGNQ